MMETMATLLIGLLGGIAVGTQGPIAGAMGQRIGGASSSFVVHLGGTILSGILILARGGEQIERWRTLPWYMLAAGVYGVVLYLTLTFTIPRLGAAGAVTLIIVGQLLTGILIDQLGLFGLTAQPIDASRLLAAALLITGGYIMVR
jgi:transporter family-2 protein